VIALLQNLHHVLSITIFVLTISVDYTKFNSDCTPLTQHSLLPVSPYIVEWPFKQSRAELLDLPKSTEPTSTNGTEICTAI